LTRRTTVNLSHRITLTCQLAAQSQHVRSACTVHLQVAIRTFISFLQQTLQTRRLVFLVHCIQTRIITAVH